MDAIKPLMDLAAGVAATGPLALVLWLYWTERTERRELAKDILQMTKDQIESEKQMTVAINVLAAKVTK